MKKLIILLVIGVIAFSYGCHKKNLPQKSVTNYKLIPNYDFEKWENTMVPRWIFPGWTTNNTIAVSCAEVDVDSLNVYHGHFAMKLLSYYNMCQARAKTKFPITVHPLSLRAFVKCKLVTLDTVSIRITIFFKGKETDSGVWLGTKSIDNYKQVDIPISQHSALADSALIEIRGGRHVINYKLGKGSEFWVDYLSLQLPQ